MLQPSEYLCGLFWPLCWWLQSWELHSRWDLLMALEVFSSLSDSVVLLFNVRKKKDITAGKTMALEREDVF